MIYSTVNHQKLPFSDPMIDDVILEWSLEENQNQLGNLKLKYLTGPFYNNEPEFGWSFCI